MPDSDGGGGQRVAGSDRQFLAGERGFRLGQQLFDHLVQSGFTHGDDLLRGKRVDIGGKYDVRQFGNPCCSRYLFQGIDKVFVGQQDDRTPAL